MSFLSIFLIAVGLAMDAFAVAVSNGILVKKLTIPIVLKFGIFFGGFQFIMPLLGWVLGISFSNYVANFAHWIAFALLTLIGGKMLLESLKNDNDINEVEEEKILSLGNMALLAIATSIDAMAVGVSFAVIETSIIFASAIIGVVAFLISCTGVVIGKKLGDMFKKRAEMIGAFILISMGVKILIEHLFFK